MRRTCTLSCLTMVCHLCNDEWHAGLLVRCVVINNETYVATPFAPSLSPDTPMTFFKPGACWPRRCPRAARVRPWFLQQGKPVMWYHVAKLPKDIHAVTPLRFASEPPDAPDGGRGKMITIQRRVERCDPRVILPLFSPRLSGYVDRRRVRRSVFCVPQTAAARRLCKRRYDDDGLRVFG